MRGAIVNASYGAMLFGLGASVALDLSTDGLKGSTACAIVAALLMVGLLAIYGYEDKP